MTPRSIYVACIGARETPAEFLPWLTAKGEQIVRAGHYIVSGNAPGADQAWAAGGNKVDPSKVILCLPWAGFEQQAVHSKNLVRTLSHKPLDTEKRYYDIAAGAHERWTGMPLGGQRLHARNTMIVQGSRVVFGYVTSSGGTATAFKIARMLQVPCHDVSDAKVRAKFDELLERAVRR